MNTIEIPKHVAIVMDGNRRWANQHHVLPIKGHRAGSDAVERTINAAVNAGVEVLSLFAFSSENWHRPKREVDYLMKLFVEGLDKYVPKLHANNIKLYVIGDFSKFSKAIKQGIQDAIEITQNNSGLKLVMAMNYGGQWDIVEATKGIVDSVLSGKIQPEDINNDLFAKYLTVPDLPFPDLFIRTSGELRISNFYLWQLAYTEMYFTDILWPDFDEQEFQKALESYSKRKRRFGGRN